MLEKLHEASPEALQFLVENRAGFELAEGAPISPTTEYLKEQIAIDGHRVLIARDGDQIAAMVMTMPHPTTKIPWIGFFLVDEKRRGQGVGRRVLGQIEDLWRGERELQLAVLKHNEPGLKFWQSLGFEVFDERISQPHGALCFVLRKEIGNG